MDLCRIPNTKHAFKTTYNPQNNEKAEQFNPTMLPSEISYIEDRPRDWDLYTPTLTYAYNY